MHVDIIMVLDRSGSMNHIREETREGVNKFIHEQKEIEGTVNFTLVQFDHEYEIPIDNVPIQDVAFLTQEDYVPRGTTAYLDALGRAILSVNNSPAAGRFAGLGDDYKVILCIVTDGKENASQEFSRPQIRDLITDRREKGWEIVFVGANESALADAVQNLNIRSENAIRFRPDMQGTQEAFGGMARSAVAYSNASYTSDESGRGRTFTVDESGDGSEDGS